MDRGPLKVWPEFPRPVLIGLILLAAAASLGWSERTTRFVAWSAVEFMPTDLARQVRRNHRRFDAGIERGLQAPLPWRVASPGKLSEALQAAVDRCAEDLSRPVPLEDLVEELGVLAVRILDANDPLAVGHDDPREGRYGLAYLEYVDSILGRVRLVYYGQHPQLRERREVKAALRRTFLRSGLLYGNIGEEFFRTGRLRDWKTFDDRSVAFGVAGVSLSRGLTDFANICGWVWHQGGGMTPPPRPTPRGHFGPTVILAPKLDGGFEDREQQGRGSSAMGGGGLALPPP